MILGSIMANLHPHHPLMSARIPWALLAGLFLLLVMWQTPALAVPKTDVITLISGDIITCEIKEMVRGKVRAKTDHMGTVSIEWDKVAHIVSNYWFLVSLKDGSLIFGQMSESNEDGSLVVDSQSRSMTIPMNTVVEIQPVRYDLWDRFDMSAAFGFNWNKGSQVLQSNLDASVKYKGSLYSWGVDLNAMVTDRGEGEITRRNELGLWLGREISGRLHGTLDGGSQRNDELGLRQRLSGGLNLGYFLTRSSHLEWQTLLGASINREWATDDSEASNNAEGRLGTQFVLFYYDSPKSDITIQADAYPNFTVKGRWRFEGSISGRQEIISDLFIRLEYYESRDSKPPSGANATSDRGIVLSIEWTK